IAASFYRGNDRRVHQYLHAGLRSSATFAELPKELKPQNRSKPNPNTPGNAMKTANRLNIETLVAIDTHVHIESDGGHSVNEAARKYFGAKGDAPTGPALAEYYRERKIACVVFSVDERLTGRKQIPNDEVAALAAANSDIMIAFASVDPTRGLEAVNEARRLIAAGGIRGFKLHPPIQQFHANDRIAYPFYEVLAEARMPVMFHTGHSGIGTGMAGGC